MLSIRNGFFSWKDPMGKEQIEQVASLKKSQQIEMQQSFFQLKNINLEVRKGELLAISGQ